MIEVPVQAIPNQTLSIQLDNNQYDIHIVATTATTTDTGQGQVAGEVNTVITIVRNNVTIVSGFRAMSGYPIIPYQYLEDGNFAFLTDNDDYPDYRKFGITQSLIYASASELETIRAT